MCDVFVCMYIYIGGMYICLYMHDMCVCILCISI